MLFQRQVLSASPGQFRGLRHSFKVMLHVTICSEDFSAIQRGNIVATLSRIVATLFQHCNAVLR